MVKQIGVRSVHCMESTGLDQVTPLHCVGGFQLWAVEHINSRVRSRTTRAVLSMCLRGPSSEEAHVASSGMCLAPSTQESLSPTYEERYRTIGDYIPFSLESQTFQSSPQL